MRLLVAIVVLILTASPSDSQTWLLETVPTGNISGHSSIVVDASHVPHIAATEWYDGRFYYHTRVTGGWVREEIARYGGVGSGRAMRLDSNGFARIYVMEARFAIQTDTGWTVSNAPGGSDWQAMAIDPGGVSRVAYIWSWGSGLYTGGFRYELEDLAPNVFMPTWASCEIEFDSNGDVHLVAMLDLSQSIKHWRRAETGWMTEDIGVGAWPSMALDPANRLHICYYAWPSRDLVHAVRNGANDWTTTSIDTDGDTGLYPSLAIDSAGRLNVSYYDATHQDLKFARGGGDGMSWTVTTVDSEGDVGKWSSLAVDGSVVHISYYEPVATESGRLHYARLTGSLTGAGDSPTVSRPGIRAVPNPFNPSTTIEYVVLVRGRVRVTVVDVKGRVVEQLVDAMREPGTHRAQYRARTPSGVYFARLEQAGGTATTKIVVLK